MSAIWGLYQAPRELPLGALRRRGATHRIPIKRPDIDEDPALPRGLTIDGRSDETGSVYAPRLRRWLGSSRGAAKRPYRVLSALHPKARLTGVDFPERPANAGGRRLRRHVPLGRELRRGERQLRALARFRHLLRYRQPVEPAGVARCRRLPGAAASGRERSRDAVSSRPAGNEANNATYAERVTGITGNAQGDGLNAGREVVAVAAIAPSGALASYSNWGEKPARGRPLLRR